MYNYSGSYNRYLLSLYSYSSRTFNIECGDTGGGYLLSVVDAVTKEVVDAAHIGYDYAREHFDALKQTYIFDYDNTLQSSKDLMAKQNGKAKR